MYHQRTAHPRPRPAAIAALVVAAALSMGLGACSSSASATRADATSGNPVKGGVLKVATSGVDPGCLDGHQISSEYMQYFGRVIYDNLVAQDTNGKIVPWLATSWDITNGGKTYTFTLRDDVHFSDGTKFDANAVKVNFEHMLDPKTKSPLAGNYIRPYQDSKVLSPTKIQVDLQYPYSPFLDVLAQGWLGMDSPTQIENDPASLCTAPIGTGPFIVTSYTKQQSVVVKRNPHYDWAPAYTKHKGPAYLAGIEFDFVAEDSVRYNSLISGQYDLTTAAPPQNAESIKENPDFTYVSTPRPGLPITWEFNTAKGPFSDIDVRKAFRAAVNVPAIDKSVGFGFLTPVDTYVGARTQYFDPKTKGEYSYDPKQADRLLDKAGWTGRDSAGYRVKDGRRLAVTINVSDATNAATIDQIQAAVKKVGIQLVNRQVTQAQALQMRYAGDYDIISGAWHTNTPDVLYIIFNSHSISTPAQPGQNLSLLRDPQIDEWTQAARETTDPATQRTLYQQVQQRLIDLAPGLPISEYSSQYAYNSRVVHGIQSVNTHPVPYFVNAWLTR